jgi:hypothetical protein
MAGLTVGNTPTIWKGSAFTLAYYCLTIIPIAYIFFKHGRRGLTAWLFLSLHVALKAAGHGIIAGAGQNGTPTYMAYICDTVGLPPLMMGTAAVLSEWFGTTSHAGHGKNDLTSKFLARSFHFVATFALLFTAAGGATYGFGFATTLQQASALLLAVLYLTLTPCAIILWWHHSKGSSLPLIWSVLGSIPWLGIRYIYQVVGAATSKPEFNPIFGRMSYRIGLVTFPEALVLLTLIIGAIMARNINQDMRFGRHGAVPSEEPGQRDAVGLLQPSQSKMRPKGKGKATSATLPV